MMEIRKAISADNLPDIAELLYKTDPYIYPYWFETLEEVRKQLPPLMLEDKFFFNIKNLYVAIDQETQKIIGVVCSVTKNTDLSYDYSELENRNERYQFVIEKYVKSLINEVENGDFVYISNVCVHEDHRGKQIANHMLKQIIEDYKNEYYNEIVLDVIKDNANAIRLYEKLGFQPSNESFKGFNDPEKEAPEVISMSSKL